MLALQPLDRVAALADDLPRRVRAALDHVVFGVTAHARRTCGRRRVEKTLELSIEQAIKLSR